MRMDEIIKKFQRLLYFILLLFLGLVILVSIINLGIIVIEFLLNDDGFILESHEIIQIFGFFLLVIIGFEFFESVYAYLRDNVIHAEVIVMVALTAAARHVILLDNTESDLHLFGLGVLIISLGVAYYLIRKTNRDKAKELLIESISE